MADPKVARIAATCREEAATALQVGDWRAAYQAAKGWVSQGGGAWTPEAWLVYAASAVLLGQPRTGVHSADLALSIWLDEQADRSILLWTRGSLVMRRLKDPKTAMPDFDAALLACPEWLRPCLSADREECSAAAAVSRKRKPSVEPAPRYSPTSMHEKVAPPLPGHRPGEQPQLWPYLLPHLTS